MTIYRPVPGGFPTYTRADGINHLLVPRSHCEWCFSPIAPQYQKEGKCLSCKKLTGLVDRSTLFQVIAVSLYFPASSEDKVIDYLHNEEILKLKHGSYAEQYAEVICHILRHIGLIKKKNAVLCPIPQKLSKHGPHGPQILAEELSQQSEYPVMDVLSFTKEVPDLKPLNQEERKVAINRSMRSHTSLIGKTLFLVDDVTTTGVTLYEGARALKEAGADCIYGIVAGRTAKPDQLFKWGALTVAKRTDNLNIGISE